MALNIFQTQEQTYDQELVLFTLNKESFALNVLKVKEIIKPIPVRASPNRHAVVEGVIQLRGMAIPLLNTYELLEIKESESLFYIIAEMGERTFALKVGDVSRIFRAHSKEVLPPDQITQGKEAFVTGVLPIATDQVAFMLDLEKVLHFIHPVHFDTDFAQGKMGMRGNYSLLLLEDSNTMRLLLAEALEDAGYDDVTTFGNGRDAANYVKDPNCETVYEAIITDIDMPYMNGHEFTKKVRQLAPYKKTPIISFSSLQTEAMERRGSAAGITQHIPKPDVHLLIQTLDDVLMKTSQSAD